MGKVQKGWPNHLVLEEQGCPNLEEEQGWANLLKVVVEEEQECPNLEEEQGWANLLKVVVE